MREVIVRFTVAHDDNENQPFLVALAAAWESHLGNPRERYEVVKDSALKAEGPTSGKWTPKRGQRA